MTFEFLVLGFYVFAEDEHFLKEAGIIS